MYVTCERRPERKWRHGERLVFWLVESKRAGGVVRAHKLAYLGSIYESEASDADHAHTRKWFWIRARERLERAAVADVDGLVGLLRRWVAPITDVEALALAKREAKSQAILARLLSHPRLAPRRTASAPP